MYLINKLFYIHSAYPAYFASFIFASSSNIITLILISIQILYDFYNYCDIIQIAYFLNVNLFMKFCIQGI